MDDLREVIAEALANSEHGDTNYQAGVVIEAIWASGLGIAVQGHKVPFRISNLTMIEASNAPI